MYKKKACSLIVSFLVVYLAVTSVTQAQDLATVDFFRQQDEPLLARNSARLWVEEDPTNIEAMHHYVSLSIYTGFSNDVVAAAEQLRSLTNETVHDVFYCQALWNSGRLDEAAEVARELKKYQSSWNLDGSTATVSRNFVWHRIEPALTRVIRFDYEFRPEILAGLNLIDDNGLVLIPIPADGLLHQDSRFEVSGSHNGTGLVWIDGNRYLGVYPVAGKKFFVSSIVQLKPVNVVSAAQQANWGYPVALQHYTLPDGVIDSEHPQIADLAAELRVDSSPFATIRNTLGYGSANIRYHGVASRASQVLAERGSHCEGRSHLIVALLRANDIPARKVRGHSAVANVSGQPSYHTIVEYYLAGVGWIPWDFGQAAGVYSPRGFVHRWNNGVPKPIRDIRKIRDHYTYATFTRLYLD